MKALALSLVVGFSLLLAVGAAADRSAPARESGRRRTLVRETRPHRADPARRRRAWPHPRRRRDRGAQGAYRVLRHRRLPRQELERADAARRDLPHRVDDQAARVRRNDDALRRRPALAHGSRLEVHPGARQSPGRRGEARSGHRQDRVLHDAGGVRDDDPGSAAPHVRLHLRQPRYDAGPQALRGRYERTHTRAHGAGVHRAARQAAAPESAGHDVGVRLLDRRPRARRRSRRRASRSARFSPSASSVRSR